MTPRVAAAGSVGGFPKRFIAVFTSNGSRYGKFFPDEAAIGPLEWTTRDVAGHVRDVPLTEIPGGRISAVLGPELNPFLEKLTLVRGLDLVNRTGNHAAHFMLSGWATDPASGELNRRRTIDQALAGASAVYPDAPYKRSLHLQVAGPQGAGAPISVQDIDGAISPVPNELDPVAAYNSIFGGLPDPGEPQADLDAVRRGGVLMRVRAAYERLRDNPRLGVDDRQRLEAHLALMDDLSARLLAVPAEGCTFPESPIFLDDAIEANIPEITRHHTEIIASAIRCNLTKVVAFQLCSQTDIRTFSFLGDAIGNNHHAISHDASAVAADKMALIGNWYSQQLAYLLELLDVVEDPETGATYLDNSIVYWGNEFGCNAYHYAMGMPVLLAGGAGGYLDTGRYIDYREHGQPILYDHMGNTTEMPGVVDDRGRPYNELLITLLQGMGLAPEDYERDGVAGFGDYSANYLNQYDLGDRKSPLPFITT